MFLDKLPRLKSYVKILFKHEVSESDEYFSTRLTVKYPPLHINLPERINKIIYIMNINKILVENI